MHYIKIFFSKKNNNIIKVIKKFMIIKRLKKLKILLIQL